MDRARRIAVRAVLAASTLSILAGRETSAMAQTEEPPVPDVSVEGPVSDGNEISYSGDSDLISAFGDGGCSDCPPYGTCQSCDDYSSCASCETCQPCCFRPSVYGRVEALFLDYDNDKSDQVVVELSRSAAER